MSRDLEARQEAQFDFSRCLASAREGDREACGRLLTYCFRYLRVAVGACARRDRGRSYSNLDLMQATLARAWEKFAEFHGASEQEFLGWLRRIAHNLIALDRRERKHQPEAVDELPEAVDPKSETWAALEAERAEVFGCALEQVDESTRQVMAWRHLEGWSWLAIGRRQGRSADAVRQADNRALRKCARLLRKMAPELFPVRADSY